LPTFTLVRTIRQPEVFPAQKEPKNDPTLALEIDGFTKTFSNRPSISFDPLFLRTTL
jgi:hypothetical protein